MTLYDNIKKYKCDATILSTNLKCGITNKFGDYSQGTVIINLSVGAQLNGDINLMFKEP